MPFSRSKRGWKPLRRRSLSLYRLIPFLLVMGLWQSTVQAEVPYPDYSKYQARAYTRYAQECLDRLGFDASCIRMLETAVEFDPTAVEVHLQLGQYLLAAGETGRALASFAQVQRLDPSRHEVLLWMAELYARDGKPTLADEKLQQYIKFHPTDALGWTAWATLSAQQGNKAQAMARLKQAMQLGFVDFERLLQDKRWHPLAEDVKNLQATGVPKQ